VPTASQTHISFYVRRETQPSRKLFGRITNTAEVLLEGYRDAGE
jgi:hypothetical protein